MSAIAFGVVPDVDDAQTRLLFSDLCAAISSAAGMRVKPQSHERPQALAAAFSRGELGLAWVSPTLLLTSPELATAVPLVCSVRQGQASFHGAAFVREDSSVKTMLDLKGKRAAWVAPTSAAGYIFPRLVLASRGIDPRDFFGSETFVHSHGNVARAVLSGAADVGAVHAVFEAGDPTRRLLRAPFLDELVPGVSARILFVTDAIPSDLIIGSPGLSSDVLEALAGALVELHRSSTAQPALMHIFGAESFARHDPKSLEPLREQVGYGRQLGVLD